MRRKEYLSQRNSRKASLHTLIDEPGTMAVEGVKQYHRIMGKSFDFPTVKPLALAEKLIRHLCPERGVVLNAFAGTGTSGQAAHNLNRPFILRPRRHQAPAPETNSAAPLESGHTPHAKSLTSCQ